MKYVMMYASVHGMDTVHHYEQIKYTVDLWASTIEARNHGQ